MFYLNEMYSIMYPSTCIVHVFRNFRAIAAKWPGVHGINATGDVPLRIGEVLSFVEHEVTIGVEYVLDKP